MARPLNDRMASEQHLRGIEREGSAHGRLGSEGPATARRPRVLNARASDPPSNPTPDGEHAQAPDRGRDVVRRRSGSAAPGAPASTRTGAAAACVPRRDRGVGGHQAGPMANNLGRSAQCADAATNATRQRTNGERDRPWGQFAPQPPADRPVRAREEQAITLSKESRTHARSAPRPGTVSRFAQQRVDERVREIMSRRRAAAQRDAPPPPAAPTRPPS
jgi:hypothetical protein